MQELFGIWYSKIEQKIHREYCFMLRKISTTITLFLLIIIALFLLLDLKAQKEMENNILSIGILQITDHPSLNATRAGFIEYLKEHGYKNEENIIIDYRNAQGSMETAEQIAQEFSKKDFDLILAISTQSLKAISKYQENRPILFAAATDPIGSGLVTPEDPQQIIGGVTDLTPVGEHLNLIKQLVPEVKKVGVLYNYSQQYSLLQVEMLQDLAPQYDLEILLKPVTDDEAVQAVKNLLGEVDAIYLPTDPTIYNRVEEMVLWANLAKKPIITGEVEGVKKGALASIIVNYYQLGRQAGEMALRIINNDTDKIELEIKNCQNNDIFINRESAQVLDIEIPQNIIKKSQII